VRITFLGGARTVTGSSFLISTDRGNLMVDCGMFQGRRDLVRRNYLEAMYDPREVDAVVLTHAHIDHSGLIPKLVREGFRGKIWATKATADLCELMLLDSAHIQEMESEWMTKRNLRKGEEPVTPIYTVEDAKRCLGSFSRVYYDEEFEPIPGFRVVYRDAGHIIGSAIAELRVTEDGTEKKIVFSGDLGVADQPIIRDPSVVTDADYLFIESTYGNRLHRTKEESRDEFRDAILETTARGGKVVIPSFAVGRTQEMLYYLGEFAREGVLPDIPIYVDSPMATSATQIVKENPQCFDGETHALLTAGETPLTPPNLSFTRSTEESIAINRKPGPAIVISASGMCTAGRIKHHLRHNLWRPEASVIFVGYQAEGTLGRLIVGGAERVRILGEDVQVNAKIYTIGGFSAHADRNELIAWASHFRGSAPYCFVIHGEERASLAFREALESELNFQAFVPRWGESVSITPDGKVESLSITEPGERVALEGSRTEKDLFFIRDRIDRLLEEGAYTDKTAFYERVRQIKKLVQDLAGISGIE